MVALTAGEPARRPRLEDVASDVGVSPATVSMVLRGVAGPSAATRERVLAAASRLGYRPDRAASVLASRRSRLIGVMLDIRNTFHAQLVEDVNSEAVASVVADLLAEAAGEPGNVPRPPA